MRMRTINEAAESLGVTREQIKRGMDDGRYPFTMWGNRRLVDIDVLREIIDAENAKEKPVGICECARRTGLSVNTIRRMRQRGFLPATKIGRNYKFDLAEVQRILAGRKKK